jgi:hypothetical protein
MLIDLDRDQAELLLEALNSHSTILKNELKDFYEHSGESYQIKQELDVVTDLTNYIQGHANGTI